MNHLDHESFAKRVLAASKECRLLDRVSVDREVVTSKAWKVTSQGWLKCFDIHWRYQCHRENMQMARPQAIQTFGVLSPIQAICERPCERSHLRALAILVFFMASFAWTTNPLHGQANLATPGEAKAVEENEIEQRIEQRMADLALAEMGVNAPQLLLLRSYVRVNTAFACRVCELTGAEEKQLAQMNDGWIAKKMREAVDSPAKNVATGIARFLQGGAARRVAPGREQTQLDIERVKDMVDKHIDAALTDEQRIAFHTEREARDKFRNESLVRVLIAALDARVFLSNEQRQLLETELATWLKKDLYWQVYFQNQNFMPDIPKEKLAKVLTLEQIECLKGVPTLLYELAQIELGMMQQEPIMIER